MTSLDRRGFLVRSAGSAATFALVPHLAAARARRPREALKVGVVGVGRQGRAILGELAKFEDVEIAAVCDIDQSRLSGGKRRARGAEGFDTLQALLDKRPDVQALFLATPTYLHRKPALLAIDAARHVFCEAPLASTIEDARAIAQAARGAGKVFQVGLQGRTNPVYGLARSFVKSGTLRDVLALRAQWNKKTSWSFASSDPEREAALNWRLDPETSLGLPGEVAAQQVDTLCWFLSRYPVSVRGTGGVRHYQDGRKVDDTVQLELAYPDGLRLQYEASLASSYGGVYEVLRGSNSSVKLAQTHGWLFKEADAATQGWEVYANRQRFHNDEGITLIADATKLAAQGELQKGVGLPNPPLYYAVESFLESVRTGGEPEVSAEAGYRAAVISIEAAKAVRSGEVRELTDELYKVD